MTLRVLVAVDDAGLRSRLTELLRTHGCAVTAARLDRPLTIDASLLDAAVVAPPFLDGAGLALARGLAAGGCRLVLLTEDGENGASSRLPDAERVRARPLDEERLLRLLTAARPLQPAAHEAPPPVTILRFAGRSLDLAGRALLDESGREVALTRREFDLLALLARSSGRVLSRDQIHNGLRGDLSARGQEPFDRSIDMLVARLRRKIERDPGSPRVILTAPGVGYKFAARVQRIELARSPAAPQPALPDGVQQAGERRQLTVLACQLRGLAAMAARLDPEDESELVRAAHRACADVAAQFQGLVAKALGDSVVIYFGCREAQEHDPERAVRAGLALIAALGTLGLPGAPHPHVGLATGVMLVGAPASPAEAPTATGQALNLALRLRALAPSGGVMICGRTRELVGDFFDCQEAKPLALADGVAPVAVWRVLGESIDAGRFEALRRAGMVELVGRKPELELLRRCWSRALVGTGQVVLVTGEPGIGKSRLAAEFEQERNSGLYACIKLFGSPHQTDAPFSAVIGELQRAAGFARTDTPADRLAKLTAMLHGSGRPTDEAVGLIADLLGLPIEHDRSVRELTPQQRKQRTLSALLARIEDMAARQPVLIVAEDAHWLDPTTMELLSVLVEMIPTLPVMLLMTARPELALPWPVYAHVSCVTLARLSREESGLLVERVAGGKALPGEVMAQILAHTDGVPLFIEELARDVLESGVLRPGRDGYQIAGTYPEHAVPRTLQGLLSARLDRLGPAKEVAQIGAIIGREFSHELLAAVCPLSDRELKGALQELISSGLVFRRGTPSSAVYSFKHALVQDAAYGSLLRDRRRALHARIAEALESQFAETAESRPELLAHHCTEAGLTEKAAGLWGRAGLQSLARSSLLEATTQLRRALGQIATLPGSPHLRRQQITLQVALANALMHTKGYASPVTREAFVQARAFIEQAEARGEAPEDPLLLSAVIYGFWVGSYVAFDGDALRDLAGQFLALAEAQGATVPRMIGHRLLATSLQCTGDILASRTHYDQALALYDPAEHRPLATRFGQDVGVVVTSNRAWTLWLLGHPEAALADADRAVHDARQIGQATTLMYALAHSTQTYLMTGSYAEAGRAVDELIALAEAKGGTAWRAFGMMHKGSLLALAGKGQSAVQMIGSGIEAWRSTGSTLWLPCYLSNLAKAHADLGQGEQAWQRIREALAAIETSKATLHEAEVLRLAGEIALLSPPADGPPAEAWFRRALTIARAQHAVAWELRAAMSLARLWRGRGRRADARRLLAPLYARFTDGLATGDLKEARALLDELAPGRSAPRSPSAPATRRPRRPGPASSSPPPARAR